MTIEEDAERIAKLPLWQQKQMAHQYFPDTFPDVPSGGTFTVTTTYTIDAKKLEATSLEEWQKIASADGDAVVFDDYSMVAVWVANQWNYSGDYSDIVLSRDDDFE